MDERRISRRELIRLGAVLGLGSAGASIVTACGDSGGGSAGSGGTTTATGGSATVGGSAGGGPKVGKGQAIAMESEVAPSTAFPFIDTGTGQQGVLVRLENGEFVAYSAVCTHQACTVGYQPETQKLACPCHGSVFDPARDAAVETGPARAPLPEIPVEVREGEVVRS